MSFIKITNYMSVQVIETVRQSAIIQRNCTKEYDDIVTKFYERLLNINTDGKEVEHAELRMIANN
jgi:hypothetical protein